MRAAGQALAGRWAVHLWESRGTDRVDCVRFVRSTPGLDHEVALCGGTAPADRLPGRTHLSRGVSSCRMEGRAVRAGSSPTAEWTLPRVRLCQPKMPFDACLARPRSGSANRCRLDPAVSCCRHAAMKIKKA
jgi:hypothetical protein